MTGTYLTGKTRFRPQVQGNDVLLVLQIEYGFHSSPVYGWRDAKLEDLRGEKIEVAK